MKVLRNVFVLIILLTLFLNSCNSGGSSSSNRKDEEASLTVNPPTIHGIAPGIYNSNQTFSITGTQGATIEYTIDGGSTWQVYTAPVILSAEGTYLVAARQSLQGITSANTPTIEITIDKTAPEPPTISGINPGFYNTDQTFTITGSESYIQYSLDGGNTWKTYTVPQTLKDEGVYIVIARQIDKAGNVSAHTTPIPITIDKTVLPPTFSGVINGGYYKNAEVAIVGEVGAIIEYSTDNGQHWSIYTDTLSFSSENTYTIIAKQTDLAGNVSSTSQVQFTIDTTSPDVPTIIGITSGIYNTNQSFTIDGEVGTIIYYTLDGGTTWNEYTGEVVLSTDGSYTIAAKQVDWAGNESAVTSPSIAVTIDKTPPVNVSNVSASVQHKKITLRWNEPTGDASFTKVRITFTPPASGISQPIEVQKGTTSCLISPLDDGTEYTFTLVSVDVVGNVSSGATISETPRDTDAPEPGSGGTITIDNNLIKNRSFWIQWAEAIDDKSEKKNLLYKIVLSTQNNISTVADAESTGNGRKVVKQWTNDLFWTSGTTSWEIVDLQPNTQYYVVVLVQDEAGNKNIYTTATATTKNYRDWPRFDGDVLTTVFDSNSNKIYVGGSFTAVNGMPYGAALNESDGGFASNFNALINGNVYAAYPDGSGGWYIGGDFTQVNGIPRNRIARINADGSLHAWYPTGGANNTVRTIAVTGGTVYVGGQFTSIGGQTRNRIAAIDAATGAIKSWNPNANDDVFTIATNGNTIFVGGAFTTIVGQSRNYIAAFDASSGSLLDWDPNASNYIYTLTISGNILYVGGWFGSIGGGTRNNIAAFDASSGSLLDWSPNADSTVYTIAVLDNTVYVGGEFNSIGGQTRKYLAAVNKETGNATLWNPDPNYPVETIAVSGNTVYVGGRFTTISGQSRNYSAAFDTTDGGLIDWNPNANYYVNTIVASTSSIYVGGEFTFVGGHKRNRIASIDAATAAITPWNPNVSTGTNPNDIWVKTIAISGNTVYIGGQFTFVGGQQRYRIAAIDATTGNITSWNPGANPNVYGYVTTITISGGTIYVGGNFTQIGGQTRNYIAAFDESTGNLTSWNPNANDEVNAIAVLDNTVYVGGWFTSIGGYSRKYLAALSASTGTATPWNPNLNEAVETIAIAGNIIYVGGQFTWVGATQRNYIAAFNASTGALTSWNPSANNKVYTISVYGGTVYAGGDFTYIGGQSRNRIAALSASNGTATSWNPNAGATVWSIWSTGDVVYVGGAFTSMGNSISLRFVALDPSTGLPKP